MSNTSSSADYDSTLKYLWDSENSEFAHLIGLLRLSKTFASDQPSMPRIIWSSSNDFTSLAFDGQEVSLANLSYLCHSLMDKASFIFKDNILFGLDYSDLFDAVDPNRTNFQDILSSTRAGYSFINDRSNTSLASQETRSRLLLHILSDQELSLRFFGVDGNSPNEVAFSEWLSHASNFVGIIALLIHITAGQPTRGTEITAATIVNNSLGGIRSVFWCKETIMIVQYYSKSSTVHGDKFIARFLPKPLANLLVAYLAIVRPLEMFACEQVMEAEGSQLMAAIKNYSTYLFVQNGVVLDTRKLSSIFSTNSLQLLGVNLKLANYRHIAVAFMDKHITHFSKEAADWENELAGDRDPNLRETSLGGRNSNLLFNEQSGHTSTVANSFYAFSTDDFAFMSRDNLQNFYLCSLEWHSLLRLHITEVQKAFLLARPLKKTVLHPRPVSQVSSTISKQLKNDASPSHTLPIITEKTVMLLGTLPSSSGTNFTTETFVPPIGYDLLRQLRNFYSNNAATFASTLQANAVAISMQRTHDILVVSGTGSGKSLTFLLPSYAERGKKTTVVVVPLVALTKDMETRCDKHGITFDIWQGLSDTSRNVDILFVAVEHCGDVNLHYHLKYLFDRFQLSRIVVDECHLALTWTEFRPSMLDVHCLRQQNVPLVLLSATVPPSMEEKLKIAFASDFVTLRSDSTARPNLCYSVVTNEDKDSLLSRLVDHLNEQDDQHQSGILYCQTIRECDEMFEFLLDKVSIKYATYYSRLSPAEKNKVQQSFMSTDTGSIRLIIATSAFGTGIDKPDVGFVYHWGIPDSIIEYSQQSGRAGRSSTLVPSAECILFTSIDEQQDILKFRKNNATVGSKNEVEKQIGECIEYTKIRTCRRYFIHSILDRSPVSCFSLTNAVLCDLCKVQEQKAEENLNTITIDSSESEESQVDEGSPDVHSYTLNSVVNLERCREGAYVMANLEQYLLYLGDSCAICWLDCLARKGTASATAFITGSSSSIHEAIYCPLIKQLEVCFKCFSIEHNYRSCPVNAMLRTIRYKICWRCFMYQNPKHNVRLHKGTFNHCESIAKDKVIVIAFMIFDMAKASDKFKQYLVQAVPDVPLNAEDEYAIWLIQEDTHTNIFRYMVIVSVFYELTKSIPKLT